MTALRRRVTSYPTTDQGSWIPFAYTVSFSKLFTPRSRTPRSRNLSRLRQPTCKEESHDRDDDGHHGSS